VRIEDDEGHETEFRIVGPDEIDPSRRYVSMDSPLAKALMKRRRDEEFTVEVPGGSRTYVVTEVRYETGEDMDGNVARPRD
jgi:transcription elongation factor GreB